MAENEDRVASGDQVPQADDKTTEDIEASLDAEMQVADNDDKANNMNLDGANDEPTVPQIETRMPAKKDVALRDFLSKMDEYAPIVCLPHSHALF